MTIHFWDINVNSWVIELHNRDIMIHRWASKGLRWRTMASVRRYEKRALVQDVYNKLDQRSRLMCARCALELEAALLRAARQLGVHRRVPLAKASS